MIYSCLTGYTIYTHPHIYLYIYSSLIPAIGGGVESACREIGWNLNAYTCMHACIDACTCLYSIGCAEGHVHDTSGHWHTRTYDLFILTQTRPVPPSAACATPVACVESYVQHVRFLYVCIQLFGGTGTLVHLADLYLRKPHPFSPSAACATPGADCSSRPLAERPRACASRRSATMRETSLRSKCLARARIALNDQ